MRKVCNTRAMLLARLRYTLALVLVALVSCAKAPAAPPAQAAQPAARKAPPAGLFLYRVQRAGQVSHLLGTIHLGFGFDEVLNEPGRLAFQGSRVVVTETDIGQDPAGRLVQAALLPAGESLDAMLDPPTWDALQARLAREIPPPVLARMKPWLPAVLLGLTELKQVFDQARPGASERMMDLELTARARATQKRLVHLETVDEQIAVFEQIALEEQLSELRHALTDAGRAQARSLVEAFASGDQTALERALFDGEQMKSTPGFYQTVLFARNARWLPTLERVLSEGDAFVAVGAAHLLGERGLLAELSQRGYSVTRVE